MFHILIYELISRRIQKHFESGVKRNFWLHAMCARTEWYSTYRIRWENWWL